MRMFFNPLHNFISPVTGRVPIQKDYILLGDSNGFSLASPILIDMRLDMIDLRRDFNDLSTSSFIIGFPNNNLPNAQALSSLTDGFMFNTAGIVSTISGIPLPNLTQNKLWIGDINNRPAENSTIFENNLPNLSQSKLWIGDSNNRPQPNQTITIDNFPSLGMPLVPVPDPTHGDLVGNVWEGTITGRPVESGRMAAMFADLILINARFLSANFIMGSGNVVLKTAMPASQFLDGLDAGILKQDIPGKIIRAIPGTDYLPGISVPPLPDISNFLLYGDNKVYRSPITYLEDPGGNGIFNFDGGTIKALNFAAKRYNGQDASVTVEGNAYISETIGARRIILYDSKEVAHRREDGVMLEGPSPLPIGTMLKWIMPSAISTEGQILQDIGANIGGGRLLGFVNMLPDGLTNTLLAQGEVGGKKTFVNATLTQNKIWVGDATNKPVETDLNFAPNDASYILKTPKIGLNNAQALSELLGGILKSAPITGTLSNAIGGIDYATEASVVAAQATADAAAAQAAAAPAEGAALAAIYFNEQMLPYSLIPLVPAGISISGAIAAAAAIGTAAAASASSAQSTADNANTRIDNLTVNLIGDVVGTNLISNPVVTAFIPNPRFTGKGYMKIPTGTTAERPSISETGMLRYNIEI